MVQASCHCGAIRIEVDEPPRRVVSCNCSFCSKRGALLAYYALERFRLVSSSDRLATYRWGGGAMRHHHCAVCGCAVFSVGFAWKDFKPEPDKPHVLVNARLFDDIELDTIPVERVDGRAY